MLPVFLALELNIKGTKHELHYGDVELKGKASYFVKVGLGDVKVLPKVVANMFGEVSGSNGT